MLLSLLATAVVFIREHTFMHTAEVPKFVTQDMGVFCSDFFRIMADPRARYGVNPSKTYWSWLWTVKKA